MKLTAYYLGVLVGYMMSCNRVPNPEILEFIPGVYVHSDNLDSATGNDTLFVTFQENNRYAVVKRTGFRRAKGNVKTRKLFKVERWTGIYDVRTGMLNLSENGKVITFLLNEKKLLLGQTPYLKIR
ncbi:hypothetical protein [Niabella beijingensis]|uniref:hypothetical protein n=1 Tax=Niabella beijingensis TaxID=2872700 RepID=UPI001CBAC3D0|nr:hypothetical protein [Niabella beijingensis]MBZ4187619.1 hypothetical protein [Niabella beijingensis]